MAVLTIDLRSGRLDEPFRRWACALLDDVSKLTGEPRENVVLVIHEGHDDPFGVSGGHLAADSGLPTSRGSAA